MAQAEGAITSGIHFLTINPFIQHKLGHRMCLWMVPQCKEQRGNKNHNELVMAVIKYGRSFYLQPVIKLPLLRFIEMLAPQSQGHVNNLHSAFWIYWQMDILSNRALQTGKQALKKTHQYHAYMLFWWQPDGFLHLWDPPKLLLCPSSPFTPKATGNCGLRARISDKRVTRDIVFISIRGGHTRLL